MRMIRRAAVLLATLLASNNGLTAPIEFGLFGDTPYTRWERENLGKLIDFINAAPLQFVIHVGDIKNRKTRCTTAYYQLIAREFQRSVHPLVYLPGDNDWTDCHGGVNRDFEPVERLATLRELFMAGPFALGGGSLKLERQSMNPKFAPYREHVRWEAGGILFVGVHVVASNNNYYGFAIDDADRQGPIDEFVKRAEAVEHWLRAGFALARERKLPAILVATHANVFDRKLTEGAGFDSFLNVLRDEVEAFDGEVVLVHGDTHVQRIDHPMLGTSGRSLLNLTRVETYGSPAYGWIRVEADASRRPVFKFLPQPFEAGTATIQGATLSNE